MQGEGWSNVKERSRGQLNSANMKREFIWWIGAAASTSRGATITSGVGEMQQRMGYGAGSASSLQRHSYGQNPVYYGNGASPYQNGAQYQYGGLPQQVRAGAGSKPLSLSCGS